MDDHAHGEDPTSLAEPTDADADAALLAAYVAGDAAAFARLYDRHERAVYRFLLRSVRNAAAADDLLQDVWMSVVRHAPKYEPRARFTTWLFAIARNKLIDYWRALPDVKSLDEMAANGSGDGTEDSPALLERLAADATTQPEAQVLDRAQARALLDAVEALPALQREAFLLHLDGGLTLAEIGALTDTGTETVKSRVRYALSRLRAQLAHWRDEVGLQAVSHATPVPSAAAATRRPT